MLSTSHVLSHPHQSPVSRELSHPILQVRKLRLNGAAQESARIKNLCPSCATSFLLSVWDGQVKKGI